MTGPATPGRRRPTLASVARKAGVSEPTVSKVLNGRGDVAASTRARVEAAIEQVGYTPQSRFRSPTAGTVEFVFDGALNAYATTLVNGLLSASESEGVDVVVRILPSKDSPLAAPSAWAAHQVVSRRVGVISATSAFGAEQLAAFKAAAVPVVVIDPLDSPSPSNLLVSVGSTNWAGGLAATDHLLGLGHRRIAFVGGPAKAACEMARLHGYLAAMNRAGAAVEPELVREGAFTHEIGYQHGLYLLGMQHPPTAVFAASDSIAQGVLEAAWRRGIAVPTDLSIVGYDDTPQAATATPPLTTVRQPLMEMGALAFRILLGLRAGRRPDSHHIEVATSLIVRSSTAPPRTLG